MKKKTNHSNFIITGKREKVANFQHQGKDSINYFTSLDGTYSHNRKQHKAGCKMCYMFTDTSSTIYKTQNLKGNVLMCACRGKKNLSAIKYYVSSNNNRHETLGNS